MRRLTILTASLLICAVTLSLAAQDATMELTTDAPVFGKMLATGVWRKAWHGEAMTEYGHWFGPGYWGGGREAGSPGQKPPVDELDAIAQRHDFAYQIAEEMGKIHGLAEEQRLKAIADSIAVRDSKRLPEDPREWDPPAPDPELADMYRDRIGFGFKYLTAGRVIGSTAIRGLVERDRASQSDITLEDLDAQSRARAAAWSSGPKVRWLYRIDLSASGNLIVENESAGINISLVPVHEGTPAVSPGELPFAVTLSLKGWGELSATELTSSDTSVVLTATRRAYFFSNNGNTITVRATGKVLRQAGADRGENYDVNIDVLPGVINFVVASKSHMELSATPETLKTDFASQVDCYETVLRARLTDWEGQGIAGVPLKLSSSNGDSREGTTDSSGSVSWTEMLCATTLLEEGQMSADVSFSVSMTGNTAGNGSVYVPSSDGLTVTLFKEEAVVVGGRVFDARNAKSVSGATVRIEGPNGSETGETDSSGRFYVRIPVGSGTMPQLSGTVSISGYESASFSATSDGVSKTIYLDPLEAVITGRVVDAETSGLIDGATVKVTQPIQSLIFTEGGLFTITGLYVGDTLTMTADAFNHKAYTKNGTITMTNPTITFKLPPGQGDGTDGGLDEEQTEDDKDEDDSDLPVIHSLMVWATPANPGPGESVIVTAQIFPPEAGVLVEISMVGTDGYTTSTTAATNAMGKVFLNIPGAESGVVDSIVARIIGERVRVERQLKYSF